MTPHDNGGDIFVDRDLIEETTMLSHGDVIWLGKGKQIIFCDADQRISVLIYVIYVNAISISLIG